MDARHKERERLKYRYRVLRDWMGEGFAPPIPSPASLPEVFQKAFARLGLADRLRETTLTEAWGEVVGPALSAHCRPGRIQRGLLLIIVDHSAWLHQISMAHKGDILRSVQQRFPHLKVKDLQLRLG